ncbi:E3 ubiquitin-protein like [Actinidia chinensis var. chinensis]|uniref:RING-type E3 ubiquitin transferase n=1 Tax=Actinidia chinensis var. chinensis TaxID=1590841 RepID=A0A2R6PBQ8_ACTCC|nr:E3 ubiquitin-protein like [Actinidia chinensis var. chinensis]
MASEAEMSEPSLPSLLERLISSRNRDRSLFIPIILGFTNPTTTTNPIQDSTDPDQETENTRESRDRIIRINPLTQGMVVIDGNSSSLDSLLRDLLSKDGQLPASKSSIEAMPTVEIGGEDEGSDSVICLEEWGIGGLAREMPCRHRFHGGCIEKWLGIHGSCPVCRYRMPVEEEGDLVKKRCGDGEERERGGRRREIWVSFSVPFNRDRSGESNHTPTCDSSRSLVNNKFVRFFFIFYFWE